MYLPWVLRAASNSDIEKRRSRETAGRLRTTREAIAQA